MDDPGAIPGIPSPFENLTPIAHAAVSQLLSEVESLKLKLSEAITENKKLREFHESALAEVRDENCELRNLIQSSMDENHNCPTSIRRKISKRSNLNDTHTSNTSNIPSVTTVNSNQTNDNQTNDSVLSRNGAKKNKKKVIQAIDTNLQNILNIVKVTKCEGFSLKQNSKKSPIKISIEKPEEIPTIRDALKSNNISFHEFKWESEKQQGFIIRGLFGISESSIPGVFEELIKAGVPACAKLSLHKTGFMRANPELTHNPLLKLVVPPDFDAKLLQNIRYLDHVSISFEKIKSKSVVQCSNCQRFGHSAAGCQHAHRCVKCGQNHLRDECPRTFNKAVKLVCCNCGGDHTANNLTVCPYFSTNFASKVIATSKNNQTSAIKNPLTATAKRSTHTAKTAASTYADMVKDSTNQKNIPNISELTRKIDIIYQLVMKHDAALQDRVQYG